MESGKVFGTLKLKKCKISPTHLEIRENRLN